MNRTGVYLYFAIRYGLYCILLAPLFLWTRFSDPFATSKAVPFQMLVALVAASTLAIRLLLESGHDRRPPIPFFPAQSPLFWASTLFIAYALASAIFGIDPHRSIWGAAERQDGLILWVHLWAWLVLINQFFAGHVKASIPKAPGKGRRTAIRSFDPDTPDIQSYLRFSFWVASAAASTALYEWFENHFGIFWLVSKGGASEASRASGVFGNPIVLGPYLLLHFFYGLYYLWSIYEPTLSTTSASRARQEKAKAVGRFSQQKRLLLAVLLAEAVQLGAILLGQTRGVLLGAGVGLLVLCLCLALYRGSERRLRIPATVLLATIVAGSGTIWLFRDSGFVARSAVLSRLTRMAPTESSSAWMRLLSWQSAIAAFKDHPVLGWGHDNIYYGLNKYYNPEHIRADISFRESTFTWWDKSHNGYLDRLAEMGVIGAFLYLALLGFLARSLWHLADRQFAFCAAAGLAGYLVSNFFAFDGFGSLFGLFLFMALLVFHESKPGSQASAGAEGIPFANKTSAFSPVRKLLAFRKPALVGALLLTLSSLYVSLETAAASAGYVEARESFARDPDSGLRAYKAAFSHYSPYRDRERLRCATLTIESVLNKQLRPDPAEAISHALELASEAMNSFPYDVSIYLTLADIYNNLGIYMDKSYLAKALEFGGKALELSPKRQEVAFYLGRTYILRNEASKAVELNRHMVAENPTFPTAHWFLGLSLIANGQQEEAKLEIRKAWELGYRFRNDEEKIVARDLLGMQEYLELIQRK